MKYSIITGLSIILLGAAKLTDSLGILALSDKLIFSIVLISYGLPTVYFSLSDGKRSLLFTGSIIFFIGVVFGISANYEILNTFGFIFSSILFIIGGSFVILFIENTKQKIFLYFGLILIILAYFSTNIFKDLDLLYYAEKFFNNSASVFAIILFLAGLIFFLFKEKW